MATNVLFEKYRLIMQKIPYQSLLRETKYNLFGLIQCIEQGPNEEKYPNYKVHIKDLYYKWVAWRNYTIQLQERAWRTNVDFQQLAMLEYIRVAHTYLCHLQLL